MADKVDNQNKKALKDVYGADLLPKGVCLQDIKDKIKDTDARYGKVLERMRILDGTDRGKLWDVIRAKFPSYQLTPDSNWINYIKENLVASIYTTGRYAELMPKSADDIQFVNEFNSALSTIWDVVKAEYYQLLAGERAALLNIGITKVGWKKDMIGGTKNYWYQGDIVFKNIDPMKFRRDPYADVFDNSEYCYYYDDYSLVHIKTKDLYKERIAEIEKAVGVLKDNGVISDTVPAATDRQKTNTSHTNYHKLTYFYIMYADDSKGNKEGFKIAEVHLLDDQYVLYCNPDLKPKMFPFAILYCNNPAGDLVGASEPAKQFSSNLTYNLINSILATHAYKAQRPPRFINAGSGINLRQFAKYGNDADKTFIVNGDATKAVHYAQFPALPPEILQTKQDLGRDIKDCSGVDEIYAGKNTGSIQNCYNYGEIKARGKIGGIVGQANKLIEDCANYGSVSGTWAMGGIVGYTKSSDSVRIVDCVNNGSITASSTGVGGIFGILETKGDTSVEGRATITGCTNNGSVEGSWGVGGIAGDTIGVTSQCVNNGSIHAKGEVAGIVGKCYGNVTECTNNGDINGVQAIVGGIVGHLHVTTYIDVINTTNYQNGSVTGANPQEIIGEVD